MGSENPTGTGVLAPLNKSFLTSRRESWTTKREAAHDVYPHTSTQRANLVSFSWAVRHLPRAPQAARPLPRRQDTTDKSRVLSLGSQASAVGLPSNAAFWAAPQVFCQSHMIQMGLLQPMKTQTSKRVPKVRVQAPRGPGVPRGRPPPTAARRALVSFFARLKVVGRFVPVSLGWGPSSYL